MAIEGVSLGALASHASSTQTPAALEVSADAERVAAWVVWVVVERGALMEASVGRCRELFSNAKPSLKRIAALGQPQRTRR